MTVDEEIESLIISNQFMSENSKSNNLIAMDSDTACLEESKKSIRKVGTDKLISC